MNDLLQIARQLRDAGLSVIPIRADAPTKSPAVSSWREFQERRPSDSELDSMFRGRKVGLGILGGRVSGGLEVLDFDEAGLFAEFAPQLEEFSPGLLDRLPRVQTPSGGMHVYFRSIAPAGNQKLAMRLVADPETGKAKAETLIETRGAGGYVLGPGSPIECHEARLPYTHVGGPSLSAVPLITGVERDAILRVARSFNLVEDEPDEPVHRNGVVKREGLTPGDDFNNRATWEEILEPHGWKRLGSAGGRDHWQRPGKTGPGWSATTGVQSAGGRQLFCVFSSNAHPFEGPRADKQCSTYTRFGAYALLNHGNDFSAATKALAAQGFGEQNTPAKLAEVSESSAIVTTNGQSPRTPHGLSDLGNAQRFLDQHGRDVLFCYRWQKWLVWDGQRWQLDDGALIEQRGIETIRSILDEARHCSDKDQRALIAKWAGKSQDANRLVAMLKMARSFASVDVQQLDADPWALNVANGTLDLRTGHLRTATRDDRITKLCPVEFDPNAECPRWRQFLETIMAGNEALIGFLQRLMGYSITGSVQEHILAVHYGCGANGKSTFLNTITETLGPDFAIKAPPDLLTVKKGDAHPTERACLFGRRLVVSTEGEDDHRLAEGLVKDLTGGDAISARRMREDFWQFTPTHTLHFCTNHKPSVRGNDTGIWRRLKLIPFAVTIPEAEQDKSLPDKLRSEFPGILAWCVRGCLDWQEYGLDEPDEVRQATAEYRSAMDVLGTFLNDCCMVGDSYKVKAADIYAVYEKWCEDSGEHKQSQRKFGTGLTDRGFRRYTSNGRWYVGLTLQ